jgi:hypothetical protein
MRYKIFTIRQQCEGSNSATHNTSTKLLLRGKHNDGDSFRRYLRNRDLLYHVDEGAEHTIGNVDRNEAKGSQS